jgi:nitrogen fixation NifU-like protein
VTVFLDLQDGRIQDVAFQGAGCAISTASASLMTEALKGKTAEEAREIFHDFQGLVTKGEDSEDLGKLAVFAGVREFPMRVKCATLAWHTLLAALDDKNQSVSTE